MADAHDHGWPVLGLLGALALVGCDRAPLDVWLSLPPPEGAATLVLGVPERSSARVFVADVSGGLDQVQLNLDPRGRDDAPLQAAYFAPSPKAAKLSTGWLSAPQPNALRRSLAEGLDALLPAPSAIYAAQLDAPARWVPTEQLAPAIGAFKVEVPDVTCPKEGSPRLNAVIEVGYLWSVPLDDTHVLFRGDDAALYVVTTPSGEVQPAMVANNYTSGDRRDGWVYLGDNRGRVWRGEADPLTGIKDPQALGAPLGWGVAVLSARAADDVFALLGNGELHSFDGQTWGRVDTLSDPGLRMVHIGPGEVLVTSDSPGVIYNATRDRVRADDGVDAGILSVAYVPEIGVLGGTSDGELLIREDGRWRTLGGTPYGWWMIDIAPHEGGVAFLLASGTVAGFQPGVGDCGDLFNSRFVSRGRLTPQRDGLLMLAKLADVSQTQAVLLESLGE